MVANSLQFTQQYIHTQPLQDLELDLDLLLDGWSVKC